ncbi:hypothetical protein BDR06DRAFT_696702 [Suillus hirtellus]|nr:hypothetical protein BDR06DRAFT_696702 [Suillus hirtellus]
MSQPDFFFGKQNGLTAKSRKIQSCRQGCEWDAADRYGIFDMGRCKEVPRADTDMVKPDQLKSGIGKVDTIPATKTAPRARITDSALQEKKTWGVRGSANHCSADRYCHTVSKNFRCKDKHGQQGTCINIVGMHECLLIPTANLVWARRIKTRNPKFATPTNTTQMPIKSPTLVPRPPIIPLVLLRAPQNLTPKTRSLTRAHEHPTRSLRRGE